jgi:hypothetical protein
MTSATGHYKIAGISSRSFRSRSIKLEIDEKKKNVSKSVLLVGARISENNMRSII